MKSILNAFALVLLLSGLAGLVGNASLSTRYFDTLPRAADPNHARIVPRTLNGQVVYLTREEDQNLDFLRHYGARAFGIGIVLGLLNMGLMAFHLERWQTSDEVELKEKK